MRLIFSGFIEDELDAIAGFIAQDNPRRAVTFIQEIRAKFERIAANPHHYALRPDIGMAARLVAHGNYVILFRVMDDTIRIEHVVYGGRELRGVISQDQG